MSILAGQAEEAFAEITHAAYHVSRPGRDMEGRTLGPPRLVQPGGSYLEARGWQGMLRKRIRCGPTGKRIITSHQNIGSDPLAPPLPM